MRLAFLGRGIDATGVVHEATAFSTRETLATHRSMQLSIPVIRKLIIGALEELN